MIQFNVQDISEYRGQLMGIATLLVIFGHSVGNGVAMPRWMESLCGLSSVGVDIFLLVSGLGLWYSLTPSQPGVHFRRGEVHIEDDVFIGLNVCICSSVTIGKGAIIGAGSVVTKDIPPYQVWAGNPARYIKDRAK